MYFFETLKLLNLVSRKKGEQINLTVLISQMEQKKLKITYYLKKINRYHQIQRKVMALSYTMLHKL